MKFRMSLVDSDRQEDLNFGMGTFSKQYFASNRQEGLKFGMGEGGLGVRYPDAMTTGTSICATDYVQKLSHRTGS